MPVTRIALSVDWSTNSGASAWIGIVVSALTGPRSSIGSPMTLRMRPKRRRADGDADLRAGVGDFLPADEAVGGVHRDGADGVLAEVLRDLEDEAAVLDARFERAQDRRQIGVELHVNDRADDLRHAADVVGGGGGGHNCLYYPNRERRSLSVASQSLLYSLSSDSDHRSRSSLSLLTDNTARFAKSRRAEAPAAWTSAQ